MKYKFMKTKEQVISYVLRNGHTNEAISKITGFLIGAGLKGENEQIKFKIGGNEWASFIKWFNGNKEDDNKSDIEEDSHPLLKLLSLLFELRDMAIAEGDEFMKNNLCDMLDFLFDEFVVDKTNKRNE